MFRLERADAAQRRQRLCPARGRDPERDTAGLVVVGPLLTVFAAVVSLWITTIWHGIDSTVIALVGIAVLLVTQVLTWRELAFNFCLRTPGHAPFDALPTWARRTLAAHAADPRPARYDLATLSVLLRKAVPEFEPIGAHGDVASSATVVAFPARHARKI